MQLQVIISKSAMSEEYFIMMDGHKPNLEFRSVISNRLDSYHLAYWTARSIETALSLAGNEVKTYNDIFAAKDGNDFCDYMAFPQLPINS